MANPPPTGRQRIDTAFARARSARRAALMPYFTLGYPDRTSSLDVIAAIAPQSDLLELGIPFSDPLADGPTIQHSSQVALAQGVTVGDCLDMVGQLRRQGITTPFLLMGYYNPILAFGVPAFTAAAARVGADGLIVADLPPEEADELAQESAGVGLALIYFLAPTSHPERIQQVARRANGFIYALSVSGVTGARTAVNHELPDFVRRIKRQTRVPVAVGFGISSPDQARAVAAYADGVIVGSALINAVDAASDKPAAAARFVAGLRQGLRPQE